MPMADNGIPDNGAGLLSAINDEHGGVIVEMKDSIDCTVFQSMLKASMSKWREEGKRGVWLKLPIELANLVGAAVEEGFWYHHAEPNYLMLVQWIPKVNSTIPANASHRVGVGAIVVNDKREVIDRLYLSSIDLPHIFSGLIKREMLVVQENSGVFRGSGVWKIPTGVVDEGEDLCAAAVREVKEETGVDAEFIELLAFRQSHKSFFQKSDLFFICFLRPLSFNIQRQESEIEAAQWMPIDEFAAQPIVEKHGVFKLIVNLCRSKMENKYAGFTPMLVSSSLVPDASSVYMNRRDLECPGSSSSML